MATWETLNDVSGGAPLPAAYWNAAVNDLNFLYNEVAPLVDGFISPQTPSAGRLSQVVAQTIPNGALTMLNGMTATGTLNYLQGGMAAESTQLIPSVSGLYIVTGSIEFPPGVAGTFQCTLMVNGGPVQSESGGGHVSATADLIVVTFSDAILISGGAPVGLAGFQTTGETYGTRTTYRRTHLSVTQIR